MNKQAIIDLLTNNYASFVEYINGLTDEEYSLGNNGKWTAGQQLQHIVLSVKPLVQVFSMDKPAIAQTFGSTDRPGRSYDALLADYFVKLNEGGKTPPRFEPAPALIEQRAALCGTLTKLIKELSAKVETFNDEELDSLQIPHPLLGSLTLREMLYNTIYHVKHHQAQVEENLKSVIND